MSGSRAAAGAGASSSGGIPSNARKVVLQLKEVVSGTDDEIYAMLRDCNMDPNETVQRLLNQDPFHEVKRRNKKKDGVGIKDSTDNRPRPANGGPSSRGGRSGSTDRGAGRGNGGPRYSNDYNSGGRGKQFVPRENGTHQNSRGSGSPAPGVSSTTSFSYAHQKLSSIPASAAAILPAAVSGAVPAPAPVAASPPAAVPTPSPAAVPSSSLANGSSLYTRPSPVAQGTWGGGPGHATMADIVKSNGGAPSAPAAQPSLPSVTQQYVPVQSAGVSSGVYSSSTDPVLHPGLDPRATGAPGAIKRELGSVGNQRPIGDRPSVTVAVEGNSVSSPSHQAHLPVSSSGGLHSLESEVQASSPTSPSARTVAQERAVNLQSGSGESASSVLRQSSGPVVTNSSASPATRTGLGGGQFSGRLGYQGQQQPVGTQKASGSGLEWKPKPSVNVLGGPASSVVTPSPTVAAPEATPPPSIQENTAVVSSATAKLQGLNIQDDQQVIIPNHLQVTEADRTRLSFGSFGAGFGTSYASSFVADEPSKIPAPAVETAPLVEAPVEQPSTSAVTTVHTQVYVHHPVSSPLESLVSSNDVAVSAPTPPAPQLELSKPDPIVQPGQYPYLPAVASYPGFGLMPHMPSPQYAYETADTQQQDVSRLPNLMQAYSDPTTSYYASFRPGTDADTRYPPFLTSNATSKFNGNIGLQSLQSSQEGSNSLAASGPSVQTSQTGNAQSAPVMPQQPLPMHPYQPTGVPLGFASVFGYQYGPSNYTYMHHPPYQHSYTGNSGYPQPPTGTGYPQAGGSSYTPAGAGSVKYPLPQQYKPGSASGNVPHSAAASGYGGYTPTPTGYAANPSATAGSATVYEDVTGQPYKDNLYIPSQQAEGSGTVWIQTQLSRDMANAGMQTNSYYSMPSQGQHTGYSHSQQPTHAHTHPGAYGGLYHPSQSGPAPIAHQLLQQPQALGAGGAGGGQAGGYQQPQRTQPTWANNY